MSKKIRIFNYIMSTGFIAWAIICIYTNIDYLMTLIGLVGLLIILALGNYSCYHRYVSKKRCNSVFKHKQDSGIKIPLILFFTFLICELIIMGIMLSFGDDLSLKTQKIVACLLCLSIFCMLVAGYKFEVAKFQDSKKFSEVRSLGIAINPKHPIGRIIYLSAFILIFFVFCLLLILGPTH